MSTKLENLEVGGFVVLQSILEELIFMCVCVCIAGLWGVYEGLIKLAQSKGFNAVIFQVDSEAIVNTLVCLKEIW